MPDEFGLTRRGVLLMAAAGTQPWIRLYAAGGDFWNKKEPAQWSSEEIDKLVTHSPWAKEFTVSSAGVSRGFGGGGGGTGGGGYPGGGGGYPGGGGGGYPGGAGGGYPGGGYPGGGMGGGRGRRGGEQMPLMYTATVRWESAKPVQEALKTPLPEGLAGDYVISLSGVPILAQGRQRGDDDDDRGNDSQVSKGLSDDVLERIKNLTYLEPKGKSPAQPAVVQKGAISASGMPTLLFGFPRDVMPLTADDREVAFTTQLGRLEVKTRFNLKDMMYHKELAL